jgi:hypothetical protein
MREELRNLSAGHRGFRVALLGTILILSSPMLAAQFPADNPAMACASDQLKDSARVGHFVFRTYENTRFGDACLQVFRNDLVVFRRTLGNNGHYTLGQPAGQYWKFPAITNGTDITGRGHPDMIVSFYTGGAHCCLSHFVFELEPDFKLLATLNAEDGDGAHFFAIDHAYYYAANDWTFAYWRTDFADSPAPTIILRYFDDGKGGGYHLALDKMHRPDPTPTEWRKAIETARAAFTENSPHLMGIGPALWGSMLDLIYTGHSGLAWSLFETAWPSKRLGRDKFLAGFCSQLKTSPYWPDLEPTLHNMPPACANAKPKNTAI